MAPSKAGRGRECGHAVRYHSAGAACLTGRATATHKVEVGGELFAGELSRGFALFQKIGLFFELRGYPQPALGNGAASRAFRKLAIPRSQFAQFFSVRRPERLVDGQYQSPHSRSEHPSRQGLAGKLMVNFEWPDTSNSLKKEAVRAVALARQKLEVMRSRSGGRG